LGLNEGKGKKCPQDRSAKFSAQPRRYIEMGSTVYCTISKKKKRKKTSPKNGGANEGFVWGVREEANGLAQELIFWWS